MLTTNESLMSYEQKTYNSYIFANLYVFFNIEFQKRKELSVK